MIKMIKKDTLAKITVMFHGVLLTIALMHCQVTPANVFDSNIYSATNDANIPVAPNGLRVIQQSYPPILGQPYYRYPITDAATMNVRSIVGNTDPTMRTWLFHWLNRCNTRKKKSAHIMPANNISPPIVLSAETEFRMEGRVEYTSVKLAHGADETMLAYGLGFVKHNEAKTGYLDRANTAGFADAAVLSWDELNKKPLAYFTDFPTDGNKHELVMRDKIWLPQARICDAKIKPVGVLLDYEVADDREPSIVQSEICELIDMLHSCTYETLFYPDPIDMPSATKDSGLTPSVLAAIAAKTDWFSLIVYPKSRLANDMKAELMAQAKILGSPIPWKKISVTVGIGGSPAPAAYQKFSTLQPSSIRRSGGQQLSIAQARDIYQFIRINNIKMVNIWGYFGDPVNDPGYKNIVNIVTGITP